MSLTSSLAFDEWVIEIAQVLARLSMKKRKGLKGVKDYEEQKKLKKW